MGRLDELSAADGHRLSAYIAEPNGKPRGGLVVLQEIFGVTRHIRAMADQFALAGFLSAAPALFDRAERGVDVPYSDVVRGRAYAQALNDEQVMLDVQAAIDRVSAAGKVAVVGYCLGGTLAYLSAARTAIDAAVAYYGGGITRHLAEKPRVPVMFHFGEKDAHIPLESVERIKAAYPEGIYHLYAAEHGFNCAERASFEPGSAALALERTLKFLHHHVG
jgi:carboxymethylenebutenolidase